MCCVCILFFKQKKTTEQNPNSAAQSNFGNFSHFGLNNNNNNNNIMAPAFNFGNNNNNMAPLFNFGRNTNNNNNSNNQGFQGKCHIMFKTK